MPTKRPKRHSKECIRWIGFNCQWNLTLTIICLCNGTTGIIPIFICHKSLMLQAVRTEEDSIFWVDFTEMNQVVWTQWGEMAYNMFVKTALKLLFCRQCICFPPFQQLQEWPESWWYPYWIAWNSMAIWGTIIQVVTIYQLLLKFPSYHLRGKIWALLLLVYDGSSISPFA